MKTLVVMPQLRCSVEMLPRWLVLYLRGDMRCEDWMTEPGDGNTQEAVPWEAAALLCSRPSQDSTNVGLLAIEQSRISVGVDQRMYAAF